MQTVEKSVLFSKIFLNHCLMIVVIKSNITLLTAEYLWAKNFAHHLGVVYVLDQVSLKLHQFCFLMSFTSCMWPNSSSGSPSSETRSLTLCRRSSRLSLELLCCCLGQSWSIFSSSLQQDFSWHSPPQQPEFDWFTSRSSMLSDTELTLGGGFSRAFLMPSMIVSSYWATRCRRPLIVARTGLSGWWLWHQQNIAL